MSRHRNGTTVDAHGLRFYSQREADRYEKLRELSAKDLITGLQVFPIYTLAPPAVVQGRKRPPIEYKPSFAYQDRHGVMHVEDAKAILTPVMRLKLHLMAVKHNIDVDLV